MSNGIGERQNEENNIAYLAAKRQLYRDAKNWNRAVCVCSVILPFALSVLQIFITHVHTYLYILSITSWAVSGLIKRKVEKEKRTAAYIQQKFDTNVYQMPWNKYLFEKDRNVSGIVAEKSEKILRDESEKSKLMNWYMVADNIGLNKGILACQRENISWDIGLRRRYKVASLGGISIMIMIVFASSLICQGDVFGELFFVMPLLQWGYDTVEVLNRDIERLNKLDEMVNLSEEKTMIDLQIIQREICLHRESSYAIPDFFYNWFKNNDEDRARRQAQL